MVLKLISVGMFLTVDTDNPSQLTLCGSSEAGEKLSLFCCRRSWGDILPKGSPGGKTNVMGDPSIKFGDCTAYIQHVHSKMWLGYPVCVCVSSTCSTCLVNICTILFVFVLPV